MYIYKIFNKKLHKLFGNKTLENNPSVCVHFKVFHSFLKTIKALHLLQAPYYLQVPKALLPKLNYYYYYYFASVTGTFSKSDELKAVLVEQCSKIAFAL